MKKKNSILLLLLFLVLVNSLVALEDSSKLSTRLKYNNEYLNKNTKSDILAYIMIYYTDIKREISYSEKIKKTHLNELALLMSKYKNSSVAQSHDFIEKNLKESESPVAFFNKIK